MKNPKPISKADYLYTVDHIVDNNTLEGMKEWFDNYLQRFNSDEPDMKKNISLKEEHTRRVCEEIRWLSKELGMDETSGNLSELCALFHDIGRFEQYARYRTFVDSRSENHAELGAGILKNNGVLTPLPERTRDLVIKVVLYHNRASVPDDDDSQCVFLTKLLRDADKLDIWRVVTEYYSRKDGKKNKAIELDLPNTTEVSKDVYDTIMAKQVVKQPQLKCLNDFKLLQAGWVFDLNFRPTYLRLRQRGYIDIIHASLPDTPEIHQLFGLINIHIDDHIDII